MSHSVKSTTSFLCLAAAACGNRQCTCISTSTATAPTRNACLEFDSSNASTAGSRPGRRSSSQLQATRTRRTVSAGKTDPGADRTKSQYSSTCSRLHNVFRACAHGRQACDGSKTKLCKVTAQIQVRPISSRTYHHHNTHLFDNFTERKDTGVGIWRIF